MRFKVHPKTRKARMALCETCDHFEWEAKTCGPPIIGKRVEEGRLCGCFMEVKTQLPWTSCPLDKWGAEKDPKLLDEAEKLLEGVRNGRVPTDLMRRMEQIHADLSGTKVKHTSCGKCAQQTIDDLREVVRQYRASED